MTISSETRKAGPYTGNGVVSQFPFYFKIFNTGDLVVVRTVGGVEEILTEGPGGYEVTILGEEGAVNFYDPPASGALITITSDVPALQPVDLTNQGGFYPTVINQALDRLTIITQQLKEASSRALTLPISSSETPDAFLTELVASADAAIAAGSAIQAALDDFTIPSAATLVGVDDGASGARYTTLAGRLTYMRTGSGALDVGTLAAGTGATARNLQTKLRDLIHVDDYGALGGATNDTVAFQNALNQAAALGGGQVHFSRNHRILSNLTIPVNVALVGPLKGAGQLQPSDGLADFDSKAGVLRVGSTVTITALASSALVQCIVIRDGLDLPFIDEVDAASGIAAFAGTAITGGGADVFLSDLLILGFARAYDSNNHARANITNVQGDCTNGIRIQAALDSVYMLSCHFWPFTTANFSWTANDATQAILMRSGIAYEFANTVDWPKVTNCFSYGYYRGFRLHNTNAAAMIGCAADGPVNAGVPRQAGSIGVLIEGTSVDNSITGLYAAGKAHGAYCGGSVNGHVAIYGSDFVACSVGVDVVGAQEVTVRGGSSRSCGYGVTVGNATSNVLVDGFRSREPLTKYINITVATAKIIVKAPDFTAPAAGASMADNAANWTLPTVASADPLLLPGHVGDVFLVTGTTGFGTITGGYPGRKVTLFFAGALNIVNGGNIRLTGSVDFAVVSGSSLTIVWSGTQWREIGRCA